MKVYVIVLIVVSGELLTGNISISGNITVTVESDLNGPSPQITLTCISTGGPVTRVRWYRNYRYVYGAKKTVLLNATTADYLNTLTVTGRLGGVYRCSIYNDKPFYDTACTLFDSINFPSVQLDPSPVNIRANGINHVRLTWTRSVSFRTVVQYRHICNTTGRVVYRSYRNYQPGVNYHYLTLNDDLDGYIHKFILNYNINNCDQVETPVLELDFSFGMYVFLNCRTTYIFIIL